MEVIDLISILSLWAYLFLQFLLLSTVLAERKSITKRREETPFVSILVPARNEEVLIQSCLKALLELDYPIEQTEILVGDDGSTDCTAALVNELACKHSQIQLITIQGQLGSARAKANVLAQLAKHAKGEYLFVTDADTRVSKGWVNTLLMALHKTDMGIASGTTFVEGTSIFARMQGLEWMLGSGNIFGFDLMGVKGTAVGNNMAFTREAYEKIGGYESIPFSVTEDFQLYKYIRRAGYAASNLMDRGSLGRTAAQTSLSTFLQQRKRWLIGAQGLPFGWFIIFAIQAAFFPCLILLLCVHFSLAWKIWVIKFLLQTVMLRVFSRRIGVQVSLIDLLLFEPYHLLVTWLMLIYYLVPVQMKWKGRAYEWFV